MKVLKCIPCKRTMKDGKFCLDCGKPLTEVITSSVKFNPMRAKCSMDSYKKKIRVWLNRIGVQNQDIMISSGGDDAEISYRLSGQSYTFRSFAQDNKTCNLAAVECFLHARVIGIERGIESIEQAFAGYEALPDPNTRIKDLSDSQLRKELKNHHPDTGDGDTERFACLMAEKTHRENNGPQE